MYGREELDECGFSMRWWYRANDADKVMDAMEARIKELEEENKHLEDYIDAYQKSEALNIEKLDKKDERIKELENQLEDVQNTMATENVDLGMENFKLKERVKELENCCKWCKGNALITAATE